MPAWGQFFSAACIQVGGTDYDDLDKGNFYAASVAAVHQQIDSLEQAGVPLNKIVIGGFSQGAAVALEATLAAKRPVAGCIALSGWMTPRARTLSADANVKSGAFLICHGTKDDMVGVDCAKASANLLTTSGRNVEFKEYKSLKHSSCPEEMDVVAKFLFSCLSPGAEVPSIDWSAADSDSDDFDDDESDDEVYVAKQALQTVKQQFESDGKSSSLETLQDFELLPDNAALVPIPGDLLWDFDDLLEQLGEKGAAEVFIRGAQAALEDPAREITLSQFKERMEEHAGFQDEGEESEDDGDVEEEDSEKEADNLDKGPNAKRPRTA